MNTRTAASSNGGVPKLPSPQKRFPEFLCLSVEKMANRRVEELKRLGIDTSRSDISQYIERVKQSKLELLGKQAMESVEDKITHLKSQKQ